MVIEIRGQWDRAQISERPLKMGFRFLNLNDLIVSSVKAERHDKQSS